MMNENNFKKKRLLIIGAGSCSKLILEEIKENSLKYNPIGIVDDNQALMGTLIEDVPVMGTTNQIEEIVNKEKIDEILIAMPSVSGKPLERIIKICKKTKKTTKIVPALFDIVKYVDKKKKDEKVRVELLPGKIRPINYEDMIKRSSPEVNAGKLKEIIQKSSILITGAAGSIGSAVAQEIIKLNPKKLILIDINEYGIHKLMQQIKSDQVEIMLGDVKNKEKMMKIMKEKRPDIVIHAAAYKHVNIVEKNIDEAVTNNILGTYNMIKAAEACHAKLFVFVSTDKAVEPSSVMGYTKRVGELMTQYMPKNETKFCSVRFGNVVGSSGSLFDIWKRQIKEGKIDITDVNMTRYFMLIQEAAILILETLALSNEGETFVFDMGKPFKIVDLAKKFAEYHGYELDKEVKMNIIGKREGEKIDEKLLYETEEIEKTENERILKVKRKSEAGNGEFFKQVNELINNKGNEQEIVESLKQIVRES